MCVIVHRAANHKIPLCDHFQEVDKRKKRDLLATAQHVFAGVRTI